MDGRGSRGSRGALYRRTRSRLSRNRQKLTQTLCRTAATVSERDGGLLGKRHGRSPFFVVSQAVDPGLLQVMERDLIPRLEKDVPNQPSQQQLEDDPSLHRFTVVFDREGYSPIFLAAMKKKRIACLTYHKHPGEDWPRQEFFATPVRLASGQETTMQLAERGTRLSNQLWLREIRKLSPRGRPTAILSTDYQTSARRLAPAMFARWSQENFFHICGKATVWIALWTIGPRL